nr:hypothetical protein CFP56_56839 [Quercus suber]
MVVSPKTPLESEMVACLINKETRSWDIDKVKGVFLPHEAEVILAISSPTTSEPLIAVSLCLFPEKLWKLHLYPILLACQFGSLVSAAKRHCSEIGVWRSKPWQSASKTLHIGGYRHINTMVILSLASRCSAILIEVDWSARIMVDEINCILTVNCFIVHLMMLLQWVLFELM